MKFILWVLVHGADAGCYLSLYEQEAGLFPGILCRNWQMKIKS